MLIRNAEIWGQGIADVRVANGAIAAIGALPPGPGEPLYDARGGALLPGLHDHHLHLAAMATRKTSVPCGPPDVTNPAGLAQALDLPGNGWIRGIGFHESVLGGTLPDAAMLDLLSPRRPLRMQHRTGRMWLLNTMAIDLLLSRAAPPPGLDRASGHLFDEDEWLRQALGGTPPDLGPISTELARYGITGATDMSPRNGPAMGAHFADQAGGGRLLQTMVLAGSLALADAPARHWQIGPLKLHLHEAALPEFDTALEFIRSGRDQGRPIAVHCVTEVELVFALALLEEAGSHPGDRIEHASVACTELIRRMARLGLHVCVQPHFIAQRGDSYLAEVEPRHHDDLYRLRSLADAGIIMAGGSDGPYGTADPWAAMAAAVSRKTASGAIIGGSEALSPEAAVALYLADPLDLTRQRRIATGAAANLCLLNRPWKEARSRLAASNVAATWISGRIVHDRVDKAPGQRLPG